MDLGLAGKVAIITGGSKGLGLAAASALVAEGARVAICGRTPATLTQAAQALAAQVGRPDDVLAVTADVSSEADLRRLVDETVSRPGTTYTAKEQDRSIRAFRDEVESAIGQKNLIDVRSPDEFAGRLAAPAHLPQEQAQRNGHIPTAANIPWSQTANDDGTFKSDDELKKLYEDKGVDFSKDTIAYCRIGERSSHTWFVLHEILEQPNVKNYDGSWTEWGSLVGVPIELGDQP